MHGDTSAEKIWHKIRKDGGPDGRGVGFYFRNVTELVLFGVRGSLRTLPPGRRQVNIVNTRKREHSRKPDELYDVVEECSPEPRLELFARHVRAGWTQWGDALNQVNAEPTNNGVANEAIRAQDVELMRSPQNIPLWEAQQG